MPPSSQSTRSSKSAEDSHSGGRGASGPSCTNYIDIDIHSNVMAAKSSAHERRSHGSRQQAAGNGHSWVGATDQLHINLQIAVGDQSYQLHKFPLLSKSGKLNRLVFESRDTEKDRIVLSDIPGGAEAFEIVARFLYGAKFELTPQNVATLRCAAEYLEMSDSLGDGNLIAKTENYLNFVVMGSWRDSITVLKTCSELLPWAEDLEIVRRCSESIAWKCSTDPHGIRWSFSSNRDSLRDWWFDDVCSLSIDMFSKVIHAVIGKGLNQGLVAAAVGCYAEKWLQLTKGSDLSTTLSKTKEESQQVSFMAFTGFNQDIVAKDAKQAQHKNRGILQGVVHLLPTQSDSMNAKFLLKLLRVACAVDATSFCKTDLAKRIGVQLEKVSLDDLLIPAYSTESAYDVDIVQQIVEFYLQDQNYATPSPPFSPRSSASGSTSTSSLSSSLRRSLSSISSSDLSGSSVTTESSSTSGRTVSASGASDSSSVRSSHGMGSTSITSSSISVSSRSGSLSFVSTSSETSNSETSRSKSTTTSSDQPSSLGLSSDESVKLIDKRFYVNTEGPSRIRTQLPPTTSNFKLGQLLESYLEEVARDPSISLGKFITLADLFTEFPRDSDDGIYRAIDTFLRAHPTLTEMERKKLCRVIDTGALSLAACVHAASNERLPLRVIVQVLFSEQIKLRNAMTGNDIINDKELDSTRIPSFSSTTSTTSRTESTSDPSNTISTSSSVSISIPTKSRSNSISSVSGLSVASPRVSSASNSQVICGLSLKDTLRFVIAEVELLRKAVQEIEVVKSRLSVMDTLQLEMDNLSTKFQEMSHDYIGMTQQVEEMTRGSKQKSGWSSGWKKVTKSFQSKDHHDNTGKAASVTEQSKSNDAAPLPRVKIADHATDLPNFLPSLKTSKLLSETLLPKTPKADQPINSIPKLADSLIPIATSKPPKRADSSSKSTDQIVPLPPAVVTPVVPVPIKLESPAVIEPQPDNFPKLPPSETLKQSDSSIPAPSTSTRPEKDSTPPDIPINSNTHKPDQNRRSKGEEPTNNRRRRQYRSTSPDYIHRHRHLSSDSDTASTTSSSSSYTSTSSSSSVSSRSRGRGRGSSHRPRPRSTSRSPGPCIEISHHARTSHHHKGAPRSHRKHRQKEGSEHHSHHSHHSSQQKDHHSVDSTVPNPRHHKDPHHRVPGPHGHRSSGHRKDIVDSGTKHKRHRRHRHHHKEIFSDSDSSSDSGTRRRHR